MDLSINGCNAIVLIRDHADVQRSEVSEAEAEIRCLKRELETVKQERDILTKAIQVFSRDQKL